MEPIVDSDGDPRLFGVGRGDSGLWLYGGWGSPDRFWSADDQWVFVRRK